MIHLHLAKHLMGHEWFSGSEEVRKVLAKLLGCPMRWPYAFDDVAATQWFEKIRDDAVERNWRKRERQVIRNLKAAVLAVGSFGKFTDGHWILDSMIANLVGYEGVGVERDHTVTGKFNGSKERVDVPRYTQLMTAAELLWLPETPISARRTVTNAVDCCLAALCDRWCFDETKLKPRGGL